MLKDSAYYIVDNTNLHKVFYYRKPFNTEGQAKTAIDTYLGEGNFTILTGAYLKLLNLEGKRSPFSKFSPKVLRKPKIKLRFTKQLNRDRLKGTGIRTNLFKARWNPLPTDLESRTKLIKKGRDKIRNQILK